ncbi:O-antigen ligase family protein [Cerasicoccus maritimus]|uniref:O-antigen ligase family protein n=1 Tax=Cerasicoccus maritimus TaxID=490089 RepID=UPI002852D67C|nr:O-antigen ligase family protein [Cerasicoccus maritimus]
MSHSHDTSTTPATYIAIAQASLLIIISSWALGGRHPESTSIITIVAWLSAIPLAMHWMNRGWFGFGKWLLCLSPWIFLSIQILASIYNPLRIPESSLDASYITWYKNNPIPFLPICYEPIRTQEYAFIQIGCLLTAVSVFTVIRKREEIHKLLCIIAANGVILAALGSWFKLSNSPKVLGIFDPVNPNFFASFRYYNHWVAFGLLSLAAAAAVVEREIQHQNEFGKYDRTRQRWDIVWIAATAILWISIPLSGSRSGLLFAMIFMCIASIRLAIAYRKHTSIFKGMERRSRKTIGTMLLLGIIIFGAIGFYLASENIMKGMDKSRNQIESNEIDQRFYASPRDCYKMVKDRPIWGWGLGSYTYIFSTYAGPEYRHELGKLIRRNEYAHNDWMQYWVELGSIGFIMLISVPLAIVVKTFRRPRKYLECFWLALGIGLFLTFAAFDFPLGPFAGIAILCTIFAAGARLSLGPGRIPKFEDYY